MGQRISLAMWNHFNNHFPEAIESMSIFKIPIEKFNVSATKITSSIKDHKQVNIERYGFELGTIINWLDENTNEQYYAGFDKNESGSYNAKRDLVLYFMEETDAMACKLMFEK